MRMTPLLALVACLAGFAIVTSTAWGDDPNTAIQTPFSRTRVPAPSAGGTSASGLICGPWLRLPNLPESKEQLGLEACEGKIYAVAGIRNGEETGSSFVYDANQGRWSPIAPLPREVQSPCLRAVKGRLFCFGGYHHLIAVKHPNVWLYDPNADAWLSRCAMPVAREDAGSAVINGQVWIVGGFTNPGHRLVSQIDVYDPDLDTWVLSFAIKPHDEDWPGRALGDFACAWGNAIWCLAGTEITDGYPYLQPSPVGFFASETDLGYVSIPDPRCYAELEVIDNRLFLVGGCRSSTTDYADTMLILDLQSQTWETPVPLPYPARGQGVCTWNGLLYVAGGYDGMTRSDFCLWMGDEDPRADTPSGTPDQTEGQ